MKLSKFISKICAGFAGILIAISLTSCSLFGPKTIHYLNDNLGTYTAPVDGDLDILVIPVSFKDYSNKSTTSNLERIETAFFGDSDETSWESVASFYEKSSFGKLKIDGFVTDWFDCGISTKQLNNYKTSDPNYSNSGEDGTWWLLNKAVKWFEDNYLKSIKGYNFDRDLNNCYDLVWLVYNAPYKDDLHPLLPDAFWAFSFWNFDNIFARRPSDLGFKKLPYLYCFASIDFISSGYGYKGIDAHTFIHETGHGLGLMDYYDTNNETLPFGCIDMMDFNIGDHCSYSKYQLGWVSPTVIKQSGTYNLKSAADHGDFILIAPDFNGSVFDEYILIEYITPTGLNKKDYTTIYDGGVNAIRGYEEPGIRISHVDARGLTFSSDFVYEYYTDNLSEMYTKAVTNSNRSSYYQNSLTGQYYLENTILAKEGNVLSKGYNPNKNEALYFKGDSFDLKGRKDMPSRTNVFNCGDVLDLQVEVIELADEATLNITIN